MNNNLGQHNQIRERLQERFRQRMTRTSTIDTLQKQNRLRARSRFAWLEQFGKNKPLLIFMSISAVFTATLGMILGLAPYKDAVDSTVINFHTDLLHCIIAFLYAVAFVAVTEFAVLVGERNFSEREEGNWWQAALMVTMMIIAGISVVGTGYAGGSIAASVLGFLSDFKEIPHSAQGWVVKAIPVLISIYGALLIGYKITSEDEKAKRLIEQDKRDARREFELHKELAEMEVEDMLQNAELEKYLDAVSRGAISRAEALAAIRAGKALQQLELEDNKDYDGDKVVGPAASAKGVERPGLWVDAGTYNDLKNKFPNVPGKFIADEQDFDLAKSINPLAASYRGCPNCEFNVPLTSKHCPNCGAEMPALVASKNGKDKGF
jgi:hypothetical protein